MVTDPAVYYSFMLYVLYVILPLIPAVIIFCLFPETKVAVSGPLQNLTIKTTGAFAAYVVTALLGFFLVRQVETQIALSRHYPVEGEIVDLPSNLGIDSEADFYRKCDNTEIPKGKFSNRNERFVVLLDHPVQQDEKVLFKYWEFDSAGDSGQLPAAKTVELKLSKTDSPQHFKLCNKNGAVTIENLEAACN